MEIRCCILNITPFGPKDDNGVGMNSWVQYIPLDLDKRKDTIKSKGYYVEFNRLKDVEKNSYFQNFDVNNILKPCTIKLSGSNPRYSSITEIIFD